MLASGICCLIGYCLYVLVVLIRFPHIEAYDAERLSYVLTGIQMSLFDSVGIAGVYLVNMLDMLIYGIVMSLFSLIVTAYTENKYLICCIPFMVAYCLTQLGSWLIGLAVQDPCNTDEVLLTIGQYSFSACGERYCFGRKRYTCLLLRSAYTDFVCGICIFRKGRCG